MTAAFEVQEQAIDVLSDVLATLRLRGEGLYVSEMTAPWGLGFAAGEAHFHVFEQGTCLLQLASSTMEPLRVESGDLVVLPQDRGHRLMDSRKSEIVPLRRLIEMRHRNGITGPLTHGGGGAPCRFLCGRYRFEGRAATSILGGLPPLIHVPGKDGRPAEWLELTVRLLASEVRSDAPGRGIAVSRLMDLVFVESIRYWLVTGDGRRSGWAGALRDPRIGAALVKIHEQPAHPWNVESLASAVAMSRSSFAQRFTELVGEPPSKYLTRWRMQVAARLLLAPGTTIAQASERVGYDSEAAFSRVFKRYMLMPPAAFRKRA